VSLGAESYRKFGGFLGGDGLDDSGVAVVS
jgi:hypothetical protein